MPVRIINFFGLSTTDDLIADAIDYAWENGADILSNSWHSSAPSTAITDAIHRAHILGRNGKGCVIAFSSSDDYTSPVAYPGSLPDVIAVGASYSYDVRCSFSNYGDNLDVVAPGDTTGSGQALWSTDITGLDFLFGGFNKILGTECWDNGNYHRYFTGTSAACPLVSGLAGLVLSQNADLTAIEVQAIIEFSCDDLVYSIQHEDPDWIELAPSGRDQYTGYGRINAADALALTQAARCRFRDADDGFLGSLDAAGNLILKQALSEAASSQDLEAHPGVAEVMVRDSSSSVARLDETGNIYLAGKLYERVLNDLDEQVSVPCLRIRDADGHTMALINAESISGTTIETHYPYIVPAGSLVLKGRAFVGADPDRESSQGH
jgi:subtilisin family serine protease